MFFHRGRVIPSLAGRLPVDGGMSCTGETYDVESFGFVTPLAGPRYIYLEWISRSSCTLRLLLRMMAPTLRTYREVPRAINQSREESVMQVVAAVDGNFAGVLKSPIRDYSNRKAFCSRVDKEVFWNFGRNPEILRSPI